LDFEPQEFEINLNINHIFTQMASTTYWASFLSLAFNTY